MKGVLAYIKNVSKGVIFDTLSLLATSRDDIYRGNIKKELHLSGKKHKNHKQSGYSLHIICTTKEEETLILS